MRLVLISNFPASLDLPRGGVEAAVSCLVRALMYVKPDLDLHVIRFPAEQDGISHREGEPAYTVHDVFGRRSALDALPGSDPCRRIEALIKRLRPDVVHVQGVAFWLDGRRYPALLTVHGIAERDTLFRVRRFCRLRAWWLAHREIPARARYRHIIAISGYVYQQLESYASGHIHFIPNPIEEEFFHERCQESGPYILFSGSIIPQKNIHGIIEAVGLLAKEGVECTLKLSGSHEITGHYEKRLDSLIQKLGIGDKIKFLGFLDRPALRQEMQMARCLVLPSFQETAPMVVAEASAMGIPSVVSPVGGLAEMVTHGYTGMIVDPCNPASIANSLRPLLKDMKLAAEFGERARQRAQAHRPERVAKQTLVLYETIMQEKVRSRR